MIFDSIENKDYYKGMGHIYTALEYLSSLLKCPDHKIDIIQDTITLTPSQITTGPSSEIDFEAHRRYIESTIPIRAKKG